MQTSIAKLSSPHSQPLADKKVQSLVVAAANAIAERFGVRVVRVSTTSHSIEVELETSKLAAIGFAAELRRATNRWAETKKMEHLWPDPPPDASEEGYEGWLGPEDRAP